MNRDHKNQNDKANTDYLENKNREVIDGTKDQSGKAYNKPLNPELPKDFSDKNKESRDRNKDDRQDLYTKVDEDKMGDNIRSGDNKERLIGKNCVIWKDCSSR